MNIERELKTLLTKVSNEENINSHEASLMILNVLKEVSEEEYVAVHTAHIRELEKDDPVLYFLNHDFTYEKIKIESQPKVCDFSIDRKEFYKLIKILDKQGKSIVMNKTSFYTYFNHYKLPSYLSSIVSDRSYKNKRDENIYISQGKFWVKAQKGKQNKYRYNYRTNCWDKGANQ